MANDDSDRGNFSKNLMSLKLQLQALFDEAGGDSLISLLDSLTALNGAEQRVALKVLTRVVDRLAVREGRLFSRDEAKMKELEEFLFHDIMRELDESGANERRSQFSLVPGGKNLLQSTRLKLTENRSRKEPHLKPVLN